MMMRQQVESVAVATSLLLLVVLTVVVFGWCLAERQLVIEQVVVGLGIVKRCEYDTERRGLMVAVVAIEVAAAAAAVVGVEKKSPVLQS